MSTLRIFDETEPRSPRLETREHARIADELGAIGVRFERWVTPATLAPDAPADAVLAAYRDEIDRLKHQGGYRAVDVVGVQPSHPQKDAMREKFLAEHTHAEDEVRFFVAGRGLFTLHVADRVFEVLCEKGDLIGVPRGTRHWFDMGPNPSFVAIRLFVDPAGWVASFTGSDIAQRFPRLDG